jgi:hypothetical protein
MLAGPFVFVAAFQERWKMMALSAVMLLIYTLWPAIAYETTVPTMALTSATGTISVQFNIRPPKHKGEQAQIATQQWAT